MHVPFAPRSEGRRSLGPLLVLVAGLVAAWVAALVLILIQLA